LCKVVNQVDALFRGSIVIAGDSVWGYYNCERRTYRFFVVSTQQKEQLV